MSRRLPAPQTRLDNAMNSTVYSNQAARVERFQSVAEGKRLHGRTLHAELIRQSEERTDDLGVLLGFAGTRRVDEASTRTNDAGSRRENVPLAFREPVEVNGGAPPLDVGIAAHRAQPGARGVDENQIERRTEGHR